MPTLSSLALVLPYEEVLKQVSQELQRNILEGKSRAVEQLEQVVVILQVHKRRSIFASEGRITPLDDILEVCGRNLCGRDVKRQDLVSQVDKAEVLPRLPIRGLGDSFGDEKATVVCETLEDCFFEGKLFKKALVVAIATHASPFFFLELSDSRSVKLTPASSPRVLR